LEGIKTFVAVVTIKAFLCPQEEIEDNNFSRVITTNAETVINLARDHNNSGYFSM
jgi:hypothetical protein